MTCKKASATHPLGTLADKIAEEIDQEILQGMLDNQKDFFDLSANYLRIHISPIKLVPHSIIKVRSVRDVIYDKHPLAYLHVDYGSEATMEPNSIDISQGDYVVQTEHPDYPIYSIFWRGLIYYGYRWMPTIVNNQKYQPYKIQTDQPCWTYT